MTQKSFHYRDGKKSATYVKSKGQSFGVCSTVNEKYVCCNVHVLTSVSNCPFDCSYCFLQDYLNDGSASVVKDISSLIDEVKSKTALMPWRFFRIGTWELGDSLALENQLPHAAELVKQFSGLNNAILELRTKSDIIEPLLDIDHKGHTVVAWSLNPDRIIKKEEHRTAPLKNRLLAAKKAQEAGYKIAFHFDPMIYDPHWKKDYIDLVDQIFEFANPAQIAWISIGSFRLNPEMKKTIEDNFSGGNITSQEMILGDDHKLRYPRPLRVQMYQTLVSSLDSKINIHQQDKGRPGPFIYLCMERSSVWKDVLGYSPRSIGHLDFLMTQNLYNRYPGLVHQPPQIELYDPTSGA